MSLARKVRAVERLFLSLDKRISEFQKNSNLTCLAGCGKCCFKPDIEASVLEFLPFAYALYHETPIEKVIEFVEGSHSEMCMIFQPVIASGDKGFCGSYAHRGLICRLFGFSATRDKNRNPRLFTCLNIKSLPNYNKVSDQVKDGLKVPMVTDYYTRLSQIDYGLANELLPINKAIRRALQEVVHYYTYRPARRPRKLPKAG